MTQPTLIGATYRNAQGAALALGTSWSFVTNVTTDDPNATFTSANDGSIPNDTGAEQEIEGYIMYGGYITTSYTIQLVAGIHDGVSWTPISSSYQIEQDAEEQYIRKIWYKVTVPAGHKVGLLARSPDGATTHYARGFVHFAKSTDGSEPKLSASCTVTTTGSTGHSLTNAWYSLRPTTTEYSGIVGATTSAGRITNNTGETITVDGFWYFFAYINSAFSRTLSTTSFKNGSAITDAIDYTGGFSSGDDYAPFWGWYSVELADGDYVDAKYLFSHVSSYTLYSYSFQHSMRSRS